MGNGNRVPGDDIIISQATHHIAGWAKHIAGWATPQLLLHLQMAGPIPQPAGPIPKLAGPIPTDWANPKAGWAIPRALFFIC